MFYQHRQTNTPSPERLDGVARAPASIIFALLIFDLIIPNLDLVSFLSAGSRPGYSNLGELWIININLKEPTSSHLIHVEKQKQQPPP